MTPFELHPDFYNQPIRLDDAEKAEPLEVLQDFFNHCAFTDIRRLLWLMTEASLARPNSAFDNASERQTLLWFYRSLETVLEAARLLCEKNR